LIDVADGVGDVGCSVSRAGTYHKAVSPCAENNAAGAAAPPVPQRDA